MKYGLDHIPLIVCVCSYISVYICGMLHKDGYYPIYSHRNHFVLVFFFSSSSRRIHTGLVRMILLPVRWFSRNFIWIHCSFLNWVNSAGTSSIWSMKISSGLALLLSVCSSNLENVQQQKNTMCWNCIFSHNTTPPHPIDIMSDIYLFG